jgi:hypothetical protein
MLRVEANAENSPLLRPPAEIRNEIFALALSGRECHIVDYHFVFRSKKDDRGTPTTTSPPEIPTVRHFLAITLVCRQCYTDAHLIPFKMTTFAFYYISLAKWAAHMLTSAQCDAITTIKVPFTQVYHSIDWRCLEPTVPQGLKMENLGDFKGLRRLILTGFDQETRIDEGQLKTEFREWTGICNLKVELCAEFLNSGGHGTRNLYWEVKLK